MIHSHSVKTWDLVMDANLREPFLMTRAALPFLREQKHGEVMAIGSDSALGIYPQDGAYAVAMHGLTTLMELIRAENSEHGIRTHILSPGVAVSAPFDAEGKPNLIPTHIAEWVLWLLNRPDHLRGNSQFLYKRDLASKARSLFYFLIRLLISMIRNTSKPVPAAIDRSCQRKGMTSKKFAKAGM